MNRSGIKRVYLAHPISNTYEAEASIKMAERIRRETGLVVYAAAENSSINDKTKVPTPKDIYEADVNHLDTCEVLVVNLTGGLQDGTISEIGFWAGMNHILYNMTEAKFPIIAYTTNSRLHNPQFSQGIPSASANHLVKGMIDRWGEFVKSEDEVIQKLRELIGLD